MERFKNILFVPLADERTQESFDHAVALAEQNQARLTFFGVVPTAPPLQDFVRLGEPPRSVTELLVADRTETLNAVAKRHASRLPISVDVATGRPVVAVVSKIIESNHDLVVLTSDGSEDQLTITRHILRTCPCPVWVLRPEMGTGRVLAAIDPGADAELNQTIIDLAKTAAADNRSELHVVHAWQFFGEEAVLGAKHITIDTQEFSEFATQVEAKHRTHTQEFLESVGVDPFERVHVINASPADAISSLTRLYRIDLLVMGSIGRNDGDGVLVGNTAEQVFSALECSALVVKPSGFESPIQRII